MSKRKKHSRKQARPTTSLSQHTRYKKQLDPPLIAGAGDALNLIDTRRDILPELLWIDSILSDFTWGQALNIMYRFLDLADEHLEDENEYVNGTISSFDLIPVEKRSDFISKISKEDLFEVALPERFRHALALYGECPARWIITEWQQKNHADFEIGIAYLRQAILRLFDMRSPYATRCRMIPLARIFKNGKISVPPDTQLKRLFTKYPNGLSENDQALAETMARAMVLTFEAEWSKSWSKYFWQQNYQISACEIAEYLTENPSPEESLATIENIKNALDDLYEFLMNSILRIQIDLYNPDKEDVLFGLLSRQFRLFSELSLNIGMWQPEIGQNFHRLMIDTQILMTWLIKREDSELFRRFKDYSLGKQKLFKLHIEDRVDTGRLDDEYEELVEALSHSIEEEKFEELITIDVGALFPNMDIRKMAIETDLKEIYDLGYVPHSAAIHGEWTRLC